MPIRRSATKKPQMTRRTSQICRSLGGPEGCKGLTTEGSAADGPDLAGGVVTVAPISFRAPSLRNGPLARDEIQSCRYAE
jgi:hypothetical protein